MTGNSNREEEVEEQYAYNVDMVDAWVFSDDTFGHAPYDERDPAHTPCPPNPRNVYQLERALNGLNSLQLALPAYRLRKHGKQPLLQQLALLLHRLRRRSKWHRSLQ